jgi:hypothetical protein
VLETLTFFLIGAFVPTLAYGLRRALDARFDRPQLSLPTAALEDVEGSDVLALIRAELQRENRRVFVRDIVVNMVFFLLGVGVAVGTHYLWS